MKNCTRHLMALSFGGLLAATNVFADNPLITNAFSADPTARVFEGRIYVFPSHDIKAPPGARQDWFCMEDYHAYSSENLLDWTDHGVIVSQTSAPWTRTNGYAMWAPDCIFKNGKYYFYFPAPGKGGGGGRGGGSQIGVCVADHPSGPWTALDQPIQGVGGIDPGLLIDPKDGAVYMFTAMGRISVSKLKDNLTEIDGRPLVVTNLPTQGTIEGPFPFERNGIYYLTYPHVANKIERLEYATASSPMGPYTPRGVILDESESGCWTVHQSMVEYKGQWYLFYHDRDMSPNFDKNRSIRADYMYFNDDGTIKKVTPTLRGIGITDAKRQIQIDRYSAISKDKASVSYLTTNTMGGWKVSFTAKDSFVQYDRVDFGKGKGSFFGRLFGSGLKSVNVRAAAPTGGTIEIRADKTDGPVLATVELPKNADWQVVKAKLASVPTGVHNLVVTHGDDNKVDVDWVSFK